MELSAALVELPALRPGSEQPRPPARTERAGSDCHALISCPGWVRSPVDVCLGTRPSQAPKARPFENTSPRPIAATMQGGQPLALLHEARLRGTGERFAVLPTALLSQVSCAMAEPTANTANSAARNNRFIVLSPSTLLCVT